MVTCGGENKNKAYCGLHASFSCTYSNVLVLFLFWIYYEAPQTNRKKPNAAADVKLEIVL